MASSPNTAHENRLAQATSPYLLQHKHNPVDWWQWGPDALAEAKRSNRPIMLSVGYAACHWCHVMAHESFEDEQTAKVMNELFVNIKVDREERPDIDQIYMNALHLLGRAGRLAADHVPDARRPSRCGAGLISRRSRNSAGRPSPTFCARCRACSARSPARSSRTARRCWRGWPTRRGRRAEVTIGLKELDAAARQIGNAFDAVHGGLRGAPKFPQPGILEMLWRAGLAHRRCAFLRDGRAFVGAHERRRHLRSSRRRLLALFGR